jgi:hypothetical protein
MAGDPMSTLWQVPVVVATLLTWLSAPPESFADAAEREALRRQLVGKATHAYTNLDLPSAALPPHSAWEGSAASESSTPSATGADESLSPAVEARGEAWWRERMTTLRAAAERNDLSAKAMQARVNALTAEIVGRDDPFQRRALREELQKALSELDRLEMAAIDARKGLESLQDEARRAGAPPGWVR